MGFCGLTFSHFFVRAYSILQKLRSRQVRLLVSAVFALAALGLGFSHKPISVYGNSAPTAAYVLLPDGSVLGSDLIK